MGAVCFCSKSSVNQTFYQYVVYILVNCGANSTFFVVVIGSEDPCVSGPNYPSTVSCRAASGRHPA
jgi:hypothetical protein